EKQDACHIAGFKKPIHINRLIKYRRKNTAALAAGGGGRLLPMQHRAPFILSRLLIGWDKIFSPSSSDRRRPCTILNRSPPTSRC
ncbi:hypothetical protein, partial [Serratia marcescens]|uniref:hypothetical protein n=1 Tax=Serratia marcescens TaxID=615 RepID=UPI001ADDED6B